MRVPCSAVRAQSPLWRILRLNAHDDLSRESWGWSVVIHYLVILAIGVVTARKWYHRPDFILREWVHVYPWRLLLVAWLLGSHAPI